MGRSSCYIRLIQILIIPPPSSPSPHIHYKTFLPLSLPLQVPLTLPAAPGASQPRYFSLPTLSKSFSLPPFLALLLAVTPSLPGGRSTPSEVFLRAFVVNQTRPSWWDVVLCVFLSC